MVLPGRRKRFQIISLNLIKFASFEPISLLLEPPRRFQLPKNGDDCIISDGLPQRQYVATLLEIVRPSWGCPTAPLIFRKSSWEGAPLPHWLSENLRGGCPTAPLLAPFRVPHCPTACPTQGAPLPHCLPHSGCPTAPLLAPLIFFWFYWGK